jgi:hypothetical protein
LSQFVRLGDTFRRPVQEPDSAVARVQRQKKSNCRTRQSIQEDDALKRWVPNVKNQEKQSKWHREDCGHNTSAGQSSRSNAGCAAEWGDRSPPIG